jgi:asparagine synthase (glutamine-hydrolysing)
MPGIVGLITAAPRQQAERELQQMVAALRHEPFYTAGTWIDESLGVYLGWVARKNSFSDRMPVSNEREDVVLVFAGEEYPASGTARRLKERGHALDLEGPSYLVHVYEEEPTFPAGLNGQFHGVVVDRARGAAMLFNDRYGMRRVYYHQSKDGFYFAAEAKALLAVRPELRSADIRGLGEFVACGCVLENRTLFESISLLPGGAAWVFRNGSLERKDSYFRPGEWEQQPPLDEESYYRQLRDVLSNNLPRYFNGHEPIGVALTGGLDTRVIMAWHKAPRRSLPCYTFGSMFRDNEDVRVARRVARQCDQTHQVIATGSEFLSRFAHYAERSVYLTDGCAELTRTPDLYVSEKAREIAPVKVVGTYGSEVLGLVPIFKPKQPLDGLFAAPLSESAKDAEATYAGVRRQHPLTFAAFRQSPWSHHGVLALEETQLTVRSPFLDNDFMRTVYRTPQGPRAASDVRLRLVSEGNPALAGLRTDRGLAGDSSATSAAVTRMLLEFTYKAEYAYDYGMPHWLARIDRQLSVFRPERLFLGRHKMFHFRLWYRDALSQYVREMLLDSRTLSRPYLERKTVEAVVRGHLTGERNYTSEIHKLLSLELLHRQFLDS